MMTSIRFLGLSVLGLATTLVVGCGTPRSTTVDDGLKTQTSTELKSLNNLEECPDLTGTFHRKDGTAAVRSIMLGQTDNGVAKMSMEKKDSTSGSILGAAGAAVDGYTIDGLRHFSRHQDSRSFDYVAICKDNRLRIAIFEGDRNIHNILYIKTLEGFDIQQRGEFGESLTQWLPSK